MKEKEQPNLKLSVLIVLQIIFSGFFILCLFNPSFTGMDQESARHHELVSLGFMIYLCCIRNSLKLKS